MPDGPRNISGARPARLTLADTPAGTTVRDLLRSGNTEVFRRLVESARDYAIFLLTPDGYIASWNAGAQRIKGYTAEEAIGKHFSIFYGPDALQRDWPGEELRRARVIGRSEDEGWRLRKDGSQFWANVVISPVLDNNGHLLGFSKVTQDLTERREHERHLKDSERNLRLLVDGVQDYAIFQLDCDGRISSWNRGAQRIKGYSAAEVIGKHFSIFYPADAVESGWPQAELDRARSLGRYEDEGWRVRKGGTKIWANVVITAIRDERNELLGFSKVTRDLTERRRHEAELREREESLRLLVEGVRDHALLLLDASGRVRTWNAGARRVFGFEVAGVFGRHVSALYTAADVMAGRANAILASAEAAGFAQVEGWLQKADGTQFWAETATTVLRQGNGSIKGYVQIIRDLSERRRVETLEAEGQRISQFIAMLSHELRNPLAPLRNATDIMKHCPLDPKLAWCVGLVERQVTHLSRLVDDLLDVSRVSSGKIRIEPVLLELNTLVRLAVDAARSVAQSHGHALTVRVAARPIAMIGDATRLTQVVVNLLNNAVKYTPDGGEIVVSLNESQDVATLQVSDNGIGMSESLMLRAFDPFVQGERTMDRAEGGLGVGLSLVKRITELHGGSVAVASPGAGLGTTVTVVLPTTPARTEARSLETAAAAPMERRILVVDDNHDAAESLAALLRFHGHEVQVAYDGAQALRFAAAMKPAIVLLDIGLPGMDGMAVARRMREVPGQERVRLVAVTGYGQSKDRDATTEAGFDLHITKPVDPDRLLQALA
jgi:PAS domain S-box-containing protein